MMTPATAAALLAYASAFDNRNVTPEAATAWSEALAPYVNLTDGKAAIVEHYGRTRDWIMPADINAGVKRTRATRIEKHPYGDLPPGLDATQAKAWLLTYRRAVGDGSTLDAAHEAADRAVNAERPAHIEADPEKVRQIVAKTANALPRPPAVPDDAA